MTLGCNPHDCWPCLDLKNYPYAGDAETRLCPSFTSTLFFVGHRPHLVQVRHVNLNSAAFIHLPVKQPAANTVFPPPSSRLSVCFRSQYSFKTRTFISLTLPPLPAHQATPACVSRWTATWRCAATSSWSSSASRRTS